MQLLLFSLCRNVPQHVRILPASINLFLRVADGRTILALQGCCFQSVALCLALGISHCYGVASSFGVICAG